MNDVTEEVDGITFVPGAEERGCNLMVLCVGLCASPGKPFLVFTYVWSVDVEGRTGEGEIGQVVICIRRDESRFTRGIR